MIQWSCRGDTIGCLTGHFAAAVVAAAAVAHYYCSNYVEADCSSWIEVVVDFLPAAVVGYWPSLVVHHWPRSVLLWIHTDRDIVAFDHSVEDIVEAVAAVVEAGS